MSRTTDNPYDAPRAESPKDLELRGIPAPPLDSGLRIKLSVMMFLQYAIWGAWLPVAFVFFQNYRGLAADEVGNLLAMSAIGAILAPFVAGQIADRYFATEKFLAISHVIGAVLVWLLAETTGYYSLLGLGFLYSLIYAPTLSLTNSLAFHHLPDRDRDFGRVRVWGTVGWIAVGIGLGQWLYRMPEESRLAAFGDGFRLSAVLGLLLGVYCLVLPHTPPMKGTSKFAAGAAMRQVRLNPLITLFLVAFPISCIHQFYFVRTVDFLTSQNIRAPWIDKIFGIGGGPMTIGQISELLVLAAMPWVATRLSRKSLLAIGISAYILRFFIFAYFPVPAAVFPALALHGLCFGCFFFVAFLIVDEETTADVRASAQSLFNLVVIGIGVIAGNYAAGQVGRLAATSEGKTDFKTLFAIPMWVAVVCLVALLLLYPRRRIARHPD